MGAEFQILGPVRALVDGAAVDLGPTMQRAVLARLLLDAGRTVSVGQLVEDVWAGRPPAGAVRTLRSYLSRLRAALGASVIITRAPGYLADVAPDAVDAVRFEAAAAEGRAMLGRHNFHGAGARLRQALALWNGDALLELSGIPFASVEADRLATLRLGAVEDRIEADLALGRHAAVVEELEALAHAHPYRERLWAHLMVALYRTGRQTEALAAFNRARRLLADEMGLEPGEELRELQAAILRQDLPSPRSGPAHNLPSQLTSFIGRTRELDEVRDLAKTHRLVTLTGTGGSGKTRLAVEAAGGAVEGFPDGVWMVDLALLEDPGFVAPAVAAALGTDESAGRPMPETLVERLAGSHVLLLLDNCEHVLDACASLVARVLAACPHVHVLATSRAPLAVPGEIVYEVAAFALPPEGETDPARYDAIRLFLARSPIPVADGAQPVVARICRDLDGIPLAIEMAAAQLSVLSPDEIASGLADRFRLLAYWSRAAPARHRTLEDSVGWSYSLLEPAERALFDQLSVFVGGFTLDAAGAIAACEGSVLEPMRRLVDASLVQRDPSSEVSRFRMLETVRQFALERAASTGRTADGGRRHALFFSTLAEAARDAHNTPEEPARLARIDADYANLRAALEWAYREHDAEIATRLARGLGYFWSIRGNFAEGEAWLRRAIELAAGLPPGVRSELMGFLGGIHMRRNEYASAAEVLGAAAELARSDADRRRLPSLLLQLSFCSRARGEHARAEEHAVEALALARELGDAAYTSHALGTLGDLAAIGARFDESERAYAEAWAVIQPQPSPAHAVAYLDSTARLAIARGRLTDGARRAEEGLARARELGDRWHTGLLLTTLAYVARRHGDLHRAGAMLDEALATLWPLRDVGGSAEALEILGGALVEADRLTEAATVLGDAEALRLRFGLQPGPFGRPYVALDRETVVRRLGEAAMRAATEGARDPAAIVEGARAIAVSLAGAAGPRPEVVTPSGAP